MISVVFFVFFPIINIKITSNVHVIIIFCCLTPFLEIARYAWSDITAIYNKNV